MRTQRYPSEGDRQWIFQHTSPIVKLAYFNGQRPLYHRLHVQRLNVHLFVTKLHKLTSPANIRSECPTQHTPLQNAPVTIFIYIRIPCFPTHLYTLTSIHIAPNVYINAPIYIYILYVHTTIYAHNVFYFRFVFRSIKLLPAMAFENLNSLETLNIQNNKLVRIPEEVMEPIMDTLRVVDIMGKVFGSLPIYSRRVEWVWFVV